MVDLGDVRQSRKSIATIIVSLAIALPLVSAAGWVLIVDHVDRSNKDHDSVIEVREKHRSFERSVEAELRSIRIQIIRLQALTDEGILSKAEQGLKAHDKRMSQHDRQIDQIRTDIRTLFNRTKSEGLPR